MRLLVGLISLFTALTASAGLYLEPYASYGAEHDKVKLSGLYQGSSFTANSTNNDTGAAYGGRAGFSLPFTVFGVDYYSTSSVKEYGPFAEFHALSLLKIRATYIMNSIIKEDTYGFKFKGNGFKVGLAFPVLPFLHLTVDYIVASYDKVDKNVSGFSLDKTDIKRSVILAGIGIPFDI